MQVSTKRDDREEFLNGLRVRLNVDEQTLSHLEMRMSGKSIFYSQPRPRESLGCGFAYLKVLGRAWSAPWQVGGLVHVE